MTLKEEISVLQKFGTALNQKLDSFDSDDNVQYWVLIHLRNNLGCLIDLGNADGELGYVSIPSHELNTYIPKISDDLTFDAEHPLDDFMVRKNALQQQFGMYIDQIINSSLVESLNIYKNDEEVYMFVAEDTSNVFWTHEMLENMIRVIAESLDAEETLAVKLNSGEGFFLSSQGPGNRIVSWYDDTYASHLMPGNYATDFEFNRYRVFGESSLVAMLFRYSGVEEIRIYDEHVCRWYKLRNK